MEKQRIVPPTCQICRRPVIGTGWASAWRGEESSGTPRQVVAIRVFRCPVCNRRYYYDPSTEDWRAA
jgi:hypothetical protein